MQGEAKHLLVLQYNLFLSGITFSDRRLHLKVINQEFYQVGTSNRLIFSIFKNISYIKEKRL